MIITVKILKKGRKYWAAATEPKGWACKVVINDITKDFTPGQVVSIEAEDIGTKSKWGSTYIYEPSAIATDEYIAHQRKLKEAEKWLGYAEGDTAKSWDHSNAIRRALDYDADIYDEIADRLTALRNKIAENIEANEARREAQKKEWAKERAQRAKEREEQHEQRKRILVNADYCPSIGEAWRMGNRPGAEIVVVTGYGKKWLLESSDACCYGMMPEDQWVRYAYYREATEEEKAELEAAEDAAHKKAAEKEAREKKIYEIENKVKKAENYAQNVDPKDLEGEVLLDTFNIYGGGERIIANDRWLWYIQNNGGDGDNWSMTNVYGSAGYPGGIGWRIPRNEALVKELRELCHARAEQN